MQQLDTTLPGDANPLPTGERADGAPEIPRLLVVDDDPHLRELLQVALAEEGFHVSLVPDGAAAVAAVEQDAFDAILMDVMMPEMDGIEACRTIRLRSPVPIIMLTARRNEADVVAGLEAGADDYVTKPFSISELTARIRANLRRVEIDSLAPVRSTDRKVFDNGRLVLDGGKRQVIVDGREVPLSRTELSLLQFLVSHEGRVLTHEEIMQHIWKSGGAAEQSRLRTFMGMLRKKLGEQGRGGRYLHSHHGSGYRFEVSGAPE
ncbi:MAG: response regulator transcription factor [Chloroflexi bacterium]|nr:response regulator transcription factor [Chloroflexota bacterium]